MSQIFSHLWKIKKKPEYSQIATNCYMRHFVCNICRQSCHSLITNHAHDKHCCFPDIDSSIEKRTIDIYDIITMTLEKLIFVLATHSDNTEK